jgi:hypothetical protein
MVFGGTQGLSDTLGKAQGLAQQALPTVPPLVAMIGPLVQAEFRLTNSLAIDLKKSLRFALFDPKVFGVDPSALLLGVTSTDAFVKSLPATDKKQNDQGNAWSFRRAPGASTGVYVNFIGSTVVLTGHAELFAKNKSFFEALIREKLPADGTVYVEIDHVIKAYKQEFEAFVAQGKVQMEAALKNQGGNEQAAGAILTVLGALREVATELEQLQGRILIGNDGLKIDGRFIARKGTELTKTLSALKGGKHGLLNRYPADAAFAISVETPPEAFRSRFLKLVGPILESLAPKNEKAKAKGYETAFENYLNAIDGQVVFGAHGDPAAGGGLTTSFLMGIRDRKVFQESSAKLATFSNQLTGWQGGMNAKVNYEKNAYKVGDYDVSVSTTVFDEPGMAAMATQFSDFLTQHTAIGDKMAIGANGPSARKVIENHANGIYKGLQSAPIKRAFKEGAKDSFAMLMVSPIGVAKRISMGGMNPLAASLGDLPDDSLLAISLGKSGEDSLQLIVDLPIKLVQQGLKAFERVKGGL